MRLGKAEAVEVTGLGFILPGADSISSVWGKLSRGQSQMGFLPERLRKGGANVAGQIASFALNDYVKGIPLSHSRRYSRDILMVLAAVEKALQDANIGVGITLPGERVGIIASSSRGPAEWWSAGQMNVAEPADPSRLLRGADGIFASLAGSPASLAAIHVGAGGFVSTLSSACVGGHQAVGLASSLITSGEADVMIVVGHEFPIVSEVIETYASEKFAVLSREGRYPDQAVKPYSRDRDGFALGEGVVVLVLERIGQCASRGGAPYARVRSVVSMNEAGHATRMDLTGNGIATTMQRALQRAQLGERDVDYVCGHGTATYYNDIAECRAHKLTFGDQANVPPIGSIKPIFGHLLGASGVLNCAALALMLRNQSITPTINTANTDPECDIDHVAEGVRSTRLQVVASWAFAIGSQNSVALLEVV